MNIFSWNINGIRAVEKKGSLGSFIENKNPDIACFQEIKIDATLLSKEDLKINIISTTNFTATPIKKGMLEHLFGLKKNQLG